MYVAQISEYLEILNYTLSIGSGVKSTTFWQMFQ